MPLNFSTFVMMKKCFFFVLALFACGQDDPKPKPVDPGEEYEQYGTPFASVADPKDVVMYEVNIRAFSEAGNFQGVIDRLDHIKSLGVNTIWLMPIHPVGQIKAVQPMGSPYSVKDYMSVNPEFGNLARLRELVEKAHEKNMAVIIDWVANHTAWDNTWITQHKNWYAQDASGNIISPPGMGWNDVAQLNYSNAEMRKAMIKAMKYWILQANVDGFRCDYVEGPPVDFWKQALDELKAIANRKLILLAEGTKASDFSSGFQMNYGWAYCDNLKEIYSTTLQKAAGSIFTLHEQEYAGLPASAVKLRYTTNHDESAHKGTPVQVYGGIQGALSASAATIFLGGSPLLYSSQEVGQAGMLTFFGKDPIEWSANPEMLETYRKLLNIYHSTDVFKAGTLQPYPHNDVVAYTRSHAGNEYLILVNVRNTGKSFSLPAALQNTNWTNALDDSPVALATSVNLQAYDYLILKKAG